MKAKIALFLIAAAMILPAMTSLFDLDARSRNRSATVVVVATPVEATLQTVISPN